MSTSFTVACKKFFGLKEKSDGTRQTLTEFADELRKLSPADKDELRPLLAEALGEAVAAQPSYVTEEPRS